ncbi:hypothetical protein DLAC_08304 [Tieghemostelium lacteum]|uniref:Glutathione S-transferase n=1 Tax=Tieghemostelium lacteum TaxID=361077 RepID=A0A151ZBT7_TIELA|nr:hypothetical protein DLAC_08304 [Tieghemostelium lacteum]|eukprot:KYQ91354.1 hypothetical protein DLAC_08304 [Tieghemostelium lacteum]
MTELIYLNGKGRGQIARNILALFGVEFKDTRVSMTPELKESLEYGVLPKLIEGDFELAEGIAIYRYLAEKYNFSGSTLQERAIAESIVSASLTILVDYHTARNDQDQEKLNKVTIPKILGHWESRLSKFSNAAGGTNRTYADLSIFTIIESLSSVAQLVSKSYPNIEKLMQYYYNHDIIGKYYKSESITSLPW